MLIIVAEPLNLWSLDFQGGRLLEKICLDIPMTSPIGKHVGAYTTRTLSLGFPQAIASQYHWFATAEYHTTASLHHIYGSKFQVRMHALKL